MVTLPDLIEIQIQICSKVASLKKLLQLILIVNASKKPKLKYYRPALVLLTKVWHPLWHQRSQFILTKNPQFILHKNSHIKKRSLMINLIKIALCLKLVLVIINLILVSIISRISLKEAEL